MLRSLRRASVAAVAAAVAALLVAPACAPRQRPGAEDLPPGVGATPGVFHDVGPRWSPDGLHVAFLRCTGDRRVQLCLASADLATVAPLLEPALATPDRPLRTGRAGSRAPEGIAWTHDGRGIVLPGVEWFTFADGDRMPGTGLWHVDASTRAVTPFLVHLAAYTGDLYTYRTPAWPQGGRHAAAVAEGLSGESIVLMRPVAGGQSASARDSQVPYDDVDWPAWSPDGRRLAVRSGIQRAVSTDPVETIRVYEPGGTYARRVLTLPAGRWPEAERGRIAASGEARLAAGAARPRAAGLAWSPDGTRLAFTLTENAARPGTGGLWALPAEGGDALRLTPPEGAAYAAPVWLGPDRICALRRAAATGPWDVVLVEAATQSVRTLCQVPTDDVDWSPDRSVVVCSTVERTGPTTLRLYRTGL